MIRIILLLILVSFNIISSSQTISNVSVKQSGNDIYISYDLNKNVTNVEVLYSEFGDEFKVLKKYSAGLYIRAGKSRNITLTPDIFFCNACIFRIRAYDRQLVDIRDNQIYKTVDINNKTWMAENLNYFSIIGSSVCPGINSEACKIYGRLYDLQTAKGVCPSGWRLPSEDDWEELIKFAGGKNVAVNILKSPPPLWTGSSSSEIEFNALPGGFAYNLDNKMLSSSLGSTGTWWTTDPKFNSKGMCFYISETLIGTSYNYPENFHLSVRCIKDNVK